MYVTLGLGIRSIPIEPSLLDSGRYHRILVTVERFRECPEIVSRLGRLGCGRENSPVIVFQQLNPVADIPSVAQFSCDPKVGTEKRRSQLGYQLFCCICSGAKLSGHIPIQAMFCSRPMNRLMEGGGVETASSFELAP